MDHTKVVINLAEINGESSLEQAREDYEQSTNNAELVEEHKAIRSNVR